MSIEEKDQLGGEKKRKRIIFMNRQNSKIFLYFFKVLIGLNYIFDQTYKICQNFHQFSRHFGYIAVKI